MRDSGKPGDSSLGCSDVVSEGPWGPWQAAAVRKRDEM